MDDSVHPSERAEASTGRSGLSTNAWAAIAAIGAAVITGAVTLVTHFLPSNEAPTSQSVAAVSVTTSGADATSSPRSTGSAAPAPRSALLDRLTGTWSGQARAGATPYTITLEITGSCVELGPCGTMTTDLLPCVGNITLVRVNDGPQFDFATRSFAPGSSASCQLRPQGGDYFTLGDDFMTYVTGYDGSVNGTLRLVG
jgi:hypothetical protein